MAFVNWGPGSAVEDGWRVGGMEVRNVVEDVVKVAWKTALDVDLPKSFPVMTYREAMNRVS